MIRRILHWLRCEWGDFVSMNNPPEIVKTYWKKSSIHTSKVVDSYRTCKICGRQEFK